MRTSDSVVATLIDEMLPQLWYFPHTLRIARSVRSGMSVAALDGKKLRNDERTLARAMSCASFDASTAMYIGATARSCSKIEVGSQPSGTVTSRARESAGSSPPSASRNRADS